MHVKAVGTRRKGPCMMQFEDGGDWNACGGRDSWRGVVGKIQVGGAELGLVLIG